MFEIAVFYFAQFNSICQPSQQKLKLEKFKRNTREQTLSSRSRLKAHKTMSRQILNNLPRRISIKAR
jgi:hypothetical protein